MKASGNKPNSTQFYTSRALGFSLVTSWIAHSNQIDVHISTDGEQGKTPPIELLGWRIVFP